MISPPESSLAIVAYLTLFVGVGFVFVVVNLLIGRFLRPSDPHAEKREIYECGEPTIGSSFVQFDLRFYVVALVFIIFEVEVAFLFPWATVFGKTTNLIHAATEQPGVVEQTVAGSVRLTQEARDIYRELGVPDRVALASAPGDMPTAHGEVLTAARGLATLAVWAVLFFFIVLLIGFAYEWRTGALDWVRAIARERGLSSPVSPSKPAAAGARQSVLSA